MKLTGKPTEIILRKESILQPILRRLLIENAIVNFISILLEAAKSATRKFVHCFRNQETTSRKEEAQT